MRNRSASISRFPTRAINVVSGRYFTVSSENCIALGRNGPLPRTRATPSSPMGDGVGVATADFAVGAVFFVEVAGVFAGVVDAEANEVETRAKASTTKDFID